MAVLTITPGTLPGNFAVTTWQEVLEAFAQYMTVDFDENYKLFIVGSATPDPADEDKIWFQVDGGTGAPININYYDGSGWESFINPSSFDEGSLIGFNAQKDQVEIPIGPAGTYLGSDGSTASWTNFDPNYASTAGRLVYFSSGRLWGNDDGLDGGFDDFPSFTPSRQVSFNVFNSPSGTYQILLAIQLYRYTASLNGELDFKDGSTIRKTLHWASANADDDSTFGYGHGLEATLTNGLAPSLVANSQCYLIGAQMFAFQI